MYYRKVNRGLAFTKPGVYSFGFILAVGMIAVATGINGLYIFLSAGLGGFIVSGMLSERAMKSVAVRSVSAGVVDAGAPFPVAFNVANVSPWFSVYAVQTHLFLEKPRPRLLSGALASLVQHTVGKLEPKETTTCSATCAPLARGSYDKLVALQQTTFPFGILEKYKLGEVDAHLLVAPAVDPSLLEELRRLVKKRLAAAEADREFFSHRAYGPKEHARRLDWRKSAGRKPEDWVVKVYRARDWSAPVVVEAAWETALAAGSAAAYEAFLCRARTACLAVHETGRAVVLELGGERHGSYEDALRALATAPSWERRAEGPGKGGDVALPNGTIRLVVEAGGARWAA